jgi:hypothetical protein
MIDFITCLPEEIEEAKLLKQRQLAKWNNKLEEYYKTEVSWHGLIAQQRHFSAFFPGEFTQTHNDMNPIGMDGMTETGKKFDVKGIGGNQLWKSYEREWVATVDVKQLRVHQYDLIFFYQYCFPLDRLTYLGWLTLDEIRQRVKEGNAKIWKKDEKTPYGFEVKNPEGCVTIPEPFHYEYRD